MDRRPALPVAVDIDTKRIRVDTRTGEKYTEYELPYTEYDIGRIRAGYCCFHCGEAQERPFPEKCWVCAYPMKDRQSLDFGEQFDGETTIGPSRTIEELRAEDDEIKEKARRAREGMKRTSSIIVPSWIRNV